jgi:hypothetical protein
VPLLIVKGYRMRHRLSMRQRVLCGIIGLCAGAVYLGFCLHAIGAAWQRKEGDLPPAPHWFQDASLFMVGFPFGFLPGLQSIIVAPFINALFWGVATAAIYWRFCRRAAT